MRIVIADFPASWFETLVKKGAGPAGAGALVLHGRGYFLRADLRAPFLAALRAPPFLAALRVLFLAVLRVDFRAVLRAPPFLAAFLAPPLRAPFFTVLRVDFFAA
jgi:hypothetical protein